MYFLLQRYEKWNKVEITLYFYFMIITFYTKTKLEFCGINYGKN